MIQYIKGYKIPFSKSPVQSCPPPIRVWTPLESALIQVEIDRLLAIGAIIPAEAVNDQFLSPFFLVPQSDGKQRFILNLKGLNSFIETEHFKLEDLRSACNLLEPDCFMGTVDLKDAYFLIRIFEKDRKYLRFIFNGQLYEFVCLPFGLCTSPFVFTKLLKPVINDLRSRGYLSVLYLDDFLCLGRSMEECRDNIKQTVDLLNRLGFIINHEKSCLIPKTRCKYLGFLLDSVTMRVELPENKKLLLLSQMKIFKKKKKFKIRDFAQLVGSLVACCPAVEYGLLHCRLFERAKVRALNSNEGSFDAMMSMPGFVQRDWDWWMRAIPLANRAIKEYKFIKTIFSDASLSGWGAFCEGESANGLWDETERSLHINHLELKAALLALKCFAADLRDVEILLKVDNTTTMAYINRMGGVRFAGLHDLACEFWSWCEERRLWVHATYIPSNDNCEADYSSRIDNTDTEWELADTAFDEITRCFRTMEIDLFASRINSKCQLYCSWRRDPEAFAFDALTISWTQWFVYAFPPFSLIARVIKKIRDDRAEGILVVPFWPTQNWFPAFQRLTVGDWVWFDPDVNLLVSPCRLKHHPLSSKLTLVVAKLSARRF